MSSRPARNTRASRRQQRAMNNIIVLLSDDDEDMPDAEEEEDLNRKPAAKPKVAAAAANPTNNPLCISLLDDSDEENASMSPNRKKKRRRFLSKAEAQAEAADRELAMKLQQQEDLAGQKASARSEKKAMTKSSDGKAVLAVQEIIALVKTAKEKYFEQHPALKQYSLETVTIDDMVSIARDFMYHVQ